MTNNPVGLTPTTPHQSLAAPANESGTSQRAQQVTTTSGPGGASLGSSRHPLNVVGRYRDNKNKNKGAEAPPNRPGFFKKFLLKQASKAVANLTQRADKSTQTDPMLTIAYDTMRGPGVSSLASFPTKAMYNWNEIYKQQDDALNTRILLGAKVEIPDELWNSPTLRGQIGHPMDMRLAINPETGELLVSKLEDNTTGWGALITTPPTALTHIFASVHEVAAEVAKKAEEDGEVPLILVLCSGHGAPNEQGTMDDNPLMAEKWVIGDQFRQKLSDIYGTDEKGREKVQVMGFLPKDFNELSMKTNLPSNGKPVVMFGYSLETIKEENKDNDLVQVINGKMYMNCLDKNGVKVLRPVSYVFNDRGLSYIEDKHGDVDPQKTIIGSMSKLGVNKALSYDMHNAFLQTLTPEQKEHWGLCARDIKFNEVSAKPDEGISLTDSIVRQVQENQAKGIKSIVKPKGTGSGHGIAVFEVGASKAEIEKGVRESQAFVDFTYNPAALEKATGRTFSTFQEYLEFGPINTDGMEKRAGQTYTVAEFLKGPEIHVPDHLKEKYGHLEGCQAELRIGLQKFYGEDGKKYWTSGLSVGKLQQPGSDIANVGGQTLNSKIDPDDLTVAASQEEILELFGINEEMATRIASFCANYSLFAQQQIYAEQKAKFGWADPEPVASASA